MNRSLSVVGLSLAAVVLLLSAAPAEKKNVKTGKYEIATLAGGCFWCVEHAFDEVDGVIETVSGYTGGTAPNPTYKQVSGGGTGHYEAVQVTFDPIRMTYTQLLDVFWRNVDPVDPTGQFCDKGLQYRSAIFFHDAAQKKAANESKATLEKSGVLPGPIVTEIVPFTSFYPAEEYHQDYHHKNPLRYNFYRTGCGRDRRLKELWETSRGG